MPTRSNADRNRRISRAIRAEAIARRDRLNNRAHECDTVEDLLAYEISKVRVTIFCDICGSKLIGRARIIRGKLYNDGYCPTCATEREGVLEDDTLYSTMRKLVTA